MFEIPAGAQFRFDGKVYLMANIKTMCRPRLGRVKVVKAIGTDGILHEFIHLVSSEVEVLFPPRNVECLLCGGIVPDFEDIIRGYQPRIHVEIQHNKNLGRNADNSILLKYFKPVE